MADREPSAQDDFQRLQITWADALEAYATTPNPQGRMPLREESLNMIRCIRARTRYGKLPDIGAMIASGKDVRFWSDPHFGHEAVIRMCDRSRFAELASMDKEIMDEVHAACDEADLVLCLGDLRRGGSLQIHRELVRKYGNKALLVVGNHDAKGTGPEAWARAGALASLAFELPSSLVASWFKPVAWPELASGTIHFGCSHWPIFDTFLPDGTWINLHGHIHHNKAVGMGVNLSVEAISYRPRQLREVLGLDLARTAADAAERLPRANEAGILNTSIP